MNSNQDKKGLQALLTPKVVAVIGASENQQSYGGRLMHNLLMLPFKGKIYPVNPNRRQIFGLDCYASIKAIPEQADLVIIVIPARNVPQVVQECYQAGAKAILIISAGFAEQGTVEGRKLEKDLFDLAQDANLPICGPNCVGIANFHCDFLGTASYGLEPALLPLQGGVSLISQSGATAFGPILAKAGDFGVGLHYIVTSGNETNLTAEDYLEYFLSDPQTKAVAMVLEGLRNGKKFLRLTAKARGQKKPILVLKIGRSLIGQEMAATHTGAMAGDDAIYDAVFRQTGVLRVEDYDELIQFGGILSSYAPAKAAGVVVVSNSGGIAGFVGDKCGQFGLTLPELQEKTKVKLMEILGKSGHIGNPADITMFARSPQLGNIIHALLEDEGIGAVILATHARTEILELVVEQHRQSDKLITVFWTGSEKDQKGIGLLRSAGIPVFGTVEKCVAAVKAYIDWSLSVSSEVAIDSDGFKFDFSNIEGQVRDLLDEVGPGSVPEFESKQILKLLGIPVPQHKLVATEADAVIAAKFLGFPVVMKTAVPGIVHKSDVGGVLMDINDELEVKEAFTRLSLLSQTGQTRVLVEEMVKSPGLEVIIGLRKDPQFGWMIMLGMGGVWVEALQMVSWRVCPVSEAVAGQMVDEIKPLRLLMGGYRGGNKYDRLALCKLLKQLSEVVLTLGNSLDGLEINPLLVCTEGNGIWALDCTVVKSFDYGR